MTTQVAKKPKESIETSEQKSYLRPFYKVIKGEDSYDIQVYLPGVASKNASITLEENVLVLKAPRVKHWENCGSFVHREILNGDYQLRLDLNVPVNADNITANSKDGILTVHLPVAQEAKPRKIKIQ